MKKTAKQDLRQLSVTDLEAQVLEGRKGLLSSRMAKGAEGRTTDSKARDLRRSISRMLTIINEKTAAEVQA